MIKQRILRLLIFAIIIGGIIFSLRRFQEKQIQEEEKVLPAQVEKIIEDLRDFQGEEVLGTFEKFVPGPLRREEGKSEVERRVGKKAEELIKEIKALPEEQLEEIKKEVFCTQVCEEVCQEVCE